MRLSHFDFTRLLRRGREQADRPVADELERRLVRRQVDMVMASLPVAGGASLVILAAVFAGFYDHAHADALLLLAAVLAVLNAAYIPVGRWWTRVPPDRPVPAGLTGSLTAALAFGGMLDALVAVQVFNLGTDTDRLLAVAVTAGVMATGGWMFSGMAQTGMAWALAICGTAIVALAATRGAEQVLLIGLIGIYGVTLSATVLITARMVRRGLESSQNLERQNQLVGLLLNDFEANASDWLWETDFRGRLIHVSQRFARLLGRDASSLHGRMLLDLLGELAVPQDAAAGQAVDHLAAALGATQPFRELTVPVLLDGRRHWWALTAKPLVDSRGRAQGWRGVGSDVTALRERDLQLTRLASFDALTGLPNRHQFGERLAAQFGADGQVRPCVLLMFDLDNFKNVNDSLGHAAGDALLCEVARRLQSQVEPDMLAARLGGDEFALIVPGTPARATVQNLAERLQAALLQP